MLGWSTLQHDQAVQTAWHAVTDYRRASHKFGIARKYVAWPSLPKRSPQECNKFARKLAVETDYPHVCLQCKTCTQIRALSCTYAAHTPELPDMSFVHALLMWKRVSISVCTLDENEHEDDQRWLHCAPHSHTHCPFHKNNLSTVATRVTTRCKSCASPSSSVTFSKSTLLLMATLWW